MQFYTVTIIFNFNKLSVSYIDLFKKNLEISGVKYEIFILSEFDDIKFDLLKPKKIYNNSNFVESINEIIAKSSTENFVFISEPFLCKKNWLKDSLIFKKKIRNCGTFIVPFSNFISNFKIINAFNQFEDIIEVLSLEKNIYCGISIIEKKSINLIGGFNTDLLFEESLIEYSLRLKKVGKINIADQFITPILSEQKIEFTDIDNLIIERKIKDLTIVEEIAYHNLSFLIEKCNLEANKFTLDFLGVFGFKCKSLNNKQLKKILSFCKLYNLSFEVNSLIIPKEYNLQKNLFVIFTTNK